jgi:hypothetical protein
MDIAKVPAPGTGSTGAPSSASEQVAQPPAGTAPIADRAEIRPLDIPAALQILLAEVRASFELQAIVMGGDAGGADAESPTQAARALLQMVLQALPDEAAGSPEWNAPASATAWNAARMRVDDALLAGLNRGVSVVSQWRDVPASVVDAAKEASTLAFAILGDDPRNPIWLRPEWAGLAPRYERFWRRRRLRRHLTDPDPASGSFDDNEPRS